MVTHMKTTIEIADGLLAKAKKRAKERKITLRALLEESLSQSLETPILSAKVIPVTFAGNGLSKEFDGAGWDKMSESFGLNHRPQGSATFLSP